MTGAFIGFIVAIAVLSAFNAIAQAAEPQPAAKIVVDPPWPNRCAAGSRSTSTALKICSSSRCSTRRRWKCRRVGHLHVAIDGAPWVWAETSGGPLIVAGLPAGPHKLEITLVNANQ